MTATIGPKGRVVIPHDLRVQRAWSDGSVLTFIEDGESVRVMSADEALRQFRDSVAGQTSPVDELIAERHRAAKTGE